MQQVRPGARQPQRQGAAPHPRERCRATSCSSPTRRSCCAPRTGILGLQERVRSKLFLRRDRYGRFFSVLVYIPRDRFNTDVRLRIEAMLKRELHGEHVDSIGAMVGESPLAQLHLIVRPKSRRARRRSTTPRLEAELAQIVRNWQDDLREQLVAPPRRGARPGARQQLRPRAAGRLHRGSQRRRRRRRRRAPGRADRPGRPAPEPVPRRTAARAACASSSIARTTTSRCRMRCR